MMEILFLMILRLSSITKMFTTHPSGIYSKMIFGVPNYPIGKATNHIDLLPSLVSGKRISRMHPHIYNNILLKSCKEFNFFFYPYRLQFWLRQGLLSQDYHVVNIILHSVICLLILFVYNIFLGSKGWNTSFYAAVLFAVHPIHAETVIISTSLLLLIICFYIFYLNIMILFVHLYQVSGIVGRAELLCSLFTWLSLLFYHHMIYAKNVLHAWAAISGFIVCITMAMLCKETGITAIVSIKIVLLSLTFFM